MSWKGDSNPGGPGGRTRKIQTNQPRGKTSHRAGGGGGSKPPGNGCAVTALALAGGAVALTGALGYGAVEVLRAVL